MDELDHRPPQHRGVTLRALPWPLAWLLIVAACGGQVAIGGGVASVAVPAEVRCVDAARLRQAAADDRTKGAAVKSDQRRVSADHRANFFASLAVIAALTCRGTAVEADEALRSALDAARKADAARSFYEAAHLWNYATFTATEVASRLAQQLPAAASR
jgi:hypothetical protein